jgi:hypothetical protein
MLLMLNEARPPPPGLVETVEEGALVVTGAAAGEESLQPRIEQPTSNKRIETFFTMACTARK